MGNAYDYCHWEELYICTDDEGKIHKIKNPAKRPRDWARRCAYITYEIC